jgi:hypothetical protein
MSESTSIPNKNQLPSEVKEVLFGSKTLDYLESSLEEAGVSDPDVSVLNSSLFFLATGETDAKMFLDGLISAYGLADEKAHELASRVVSKLLLPYQSVLPASIEDLVSGSRATQKQPQVEQAAESEQKPTAQKKPVIIEPDFSSEETEVKTIAQEKAPMIETVEPLDVPGIVKEICGNPAFQFSDPQLQERCVKLIESRVRDVRTPEQTRAQLEKTIDKGGLGVTGRRLSDMLAMIEGRVLAFQGNFAQEEQRKRAEKRSGLPDKAELAKKEEALLTKKYVALTGKVPDAHVAPAAPSVSRTSVAISAHHEQLVREGKIDAGKVKQAVQDAQQVAATPRLRVTASMQEVTFEKRLSGPVDELRSLTLTDFRRLSKDSSAAATKIKDKVESLEDQGYDKKVEAVQAWRSSPLNQMYVGITRDAVLLGVSVAEILEKKRAAGEEVLTDEELKAVMKLNADLRF